MKISSRPSEFRKHIEGSERLRNRRIMAAEVDEDEEAFEDFDEFDDSPRRLEREEMDDEIELESDEEEDEESEVVDSDEVEPDDPNIEVENNIAEHYIAECSRCHGIFISAVMESDQEVESISGICPLCNKESDQFLKWVVKPV